ncbi:dual specificity protein phosphatase family protein [Kaarinaea lacus]
MTTNPLTIDECKPHWRKALFWALLCGTGFFLVYGSSNATSASLENLPSLFFPWEENIPFIPQLIVPYLSIDLLFVIAFFFCRDHYQMRALTLRLTFAIIVSASVFLLFPLRFGFERPVVDGVFGAMFAALSLDLPYNQCPSLHISLAIILWQIYKQRSRGLMKLILGLWFVLIGASTLFVFQHHVIDIYGGVIVGLLSLYLFPLKLEQKPLYVATTKQHTRIGLYYLGAAIACIITVTSFNNWTILLLYPATSLSLVASAYFSGRSNFLQKHQGEIPLPMQLLFAPYLLAVCWTWKFYRDSRSPYQEIAPGVLFGRRLSIIETNELVAQGVVAMIDLAPEVKTPLSISNIHYKHIPILDMTSPNLRQFKSAVDFINTHKNTGKVYIHCALGYLRSAAVVAAYLMLSGQGIEQAIKQLHNVQASSKLPPYVIASLRQITAGSSS